MAMTNHERVGKAMNLLRDGLGPFVAREVGERLKAGKIREDTVRKFAGDPMLGQTLIRDWDAAGLLKLMWEAWNEVFRASLGFSERSLVSELRDWRNQWAHQKTLTSDDADRALDSAQRLLAAVAAPEADAVGGMKIELRRLVFEEQARSVQRRAARVETAGGGKLTPWREVATPHPDVAGGRYRQAEFAADLWQVWRNEGEAEYRDPQEFFRRTFLTSSLKGLLTGAVSRLNGRGGDPVVQLQTNFGGGKTHSLLALYHLFSGAALRSLPEVDALVAEAGADSVPKANRVVLVGNKISAGGPVTKPDGTGVRTLWGELAWQLGGREAFERVRADDERATNPGDVLRELLERHGPCLVLIDEWVAYARQLHEKSDLPGGSFETQFTFAQALTEAVKVTKDSLLVVALPASHRGDEDEDQRSPHTEADDTEVGGVRGREALERLRNVVARVESSWRPASAEESFEIVRRRLFQPFDRAGAYRQRDATVRSFADLYRRQETEFPPECRDAEYEKRLRSAYPIHPEVFDRLYTDWSALARFQRTRGVLRLMAAVIHQLWENGDSNPLILPSTIPVDAPAVQNELTRYLPDDWRPVIDKDVDGERSLPVKIDREIPSLGRCHAARRVARTVWLGSAPTPKAAHRGIDRSRVKLGCLTPGERPAVFGDALSRLAASATYLYEDETRFWYDTQPTVAKLARDRAEELRREPDQVAAELERRLKQELRNRGGFAGVHPLPRSAADVPDEPETRLVVLSAEHPHAKGPRSAAEAAAKAIFDTPSRERRNTLAFLAADKARYQDLDEALRRFLAWESIVADGDRLNLDPNQTRKAKQQKSDADATAAAQIPETYQWLLTPEQPTPQALVSWRAVRLTRGGGLAERAWKRLSSDELVVGSLGPAVLRRHLDSVPLWDGDHVPIRKLVEHFARFLYLPRLAGPKVLTEAIERGVGLLTWEADAYAVADSYDVEAGRYAGLQSGAVGVRVSPDSSGLVVQAAVARRQQDAEVPRPVPDGGGDRPGGEGGEPPVVPTPDPSPSDDEQKERGAAVRRFHGAVRLNAKRVGKDASEIAQAVVGPLEGLVGSEVEVTLEIHAELPDGAPEQVVRTVTENSRTLKFESHGFEES